ncbi:MAG: signal peptidase II [Epulopiscium sp. Nele67-Bin005]|nr:MAG: signal peptidase II [Epulopiscium sp. Nele67-Bin005]
MKYIIPIIIAGLIALDQGIKYWAVNNLQLAGQIKIWPDVFHLAYVENRGAAFGIMQNRQTLFIIITLAVLGGILWQWKQIPDNKSGKAMKIALILIVSGAIGNLIDRIILGYVVDMFYFVLIDFPVFNVADICVVCGTILLMPILIFGDIEPAEEEEFNTNLETEN